MKKYIFLFFILFFFIENLNSQSKDYATPQVPSSFFLDNMKIEINDNARKEIQNEVDALHLNRKYLLLILDRVSIYFPIIEKILKEENIPDDFKYLSIQESSLISDAESSSNAVGFWQFKSETAKSHGLQINKFVDERLNIISSTRAACSYLKENNFYFDNWIYSLLSYMTGLTGARTIVDEKMYGAKRLKIDKKTHWYIKKFIAHKVAFQEELNHKNSENIILKEYSSYNNRSIKSISDEFDIDYDRLVSYNKWVKSKQIPDDKNYFVIVPINQKNILAFQNIKIDAVSENTVLYNESESEFDKNIISIANLAIIYLNGLPAIIADSLDSFNSISKIFNISIENLKKYNDMDDNQKIENGNIYYLKRKRKKARVFTYNPRGDDTLWNVSQKFGIRLSSLKKLNNIQNNQLPLNKKIILRNSIWF